MLKHSSEKLNFIPKKKQNERQSRSTVSKKSLLSETLNKQTNKQKEIQSFSATIPHYPAGTTF
jgi:hypothetical protein